MNESTFVPGEADRKDSSGATGSGSAGVFLENVTVRHALISVLENLGLQAIILSADSLPSRIPQEMEMVVADESAIPHVRSLFDGDRSPGQSLPPALIAVGTHTPAEPDALCDAFIAVPSMLSDVTARLSVILYSRRALSRRYRPAFEELHLSRNIFRSVTNSISVSDARLPDMPLVYVNPSFELMTGYTLDEVRGKNCRFLQGADADQPARRAIREAIAERRQTVVLLRNYRRDGTCFWNELALSPIFSADGELTHYVGIQADVSDRVRVESALRESEKLAAVGRLASAISHEINNPLEAVMNLVYLALETLPHQPGNAEVREYLSAADEELRRVKLITAQSLRFARQSTRPEAVLLNETVQAVLDVYRARLRNYGVQVRPRLRSTLPAVVYDSEVRQVLSNLVNNAIDAMKQSSRRILTVRTRQATDLRGNRPGVLITLADSGTGIPAAARDSIFRAFFSTKGHSGTGLGLWVTQSIIERHGGTMRFRTSTGDRPGTTFQIFLPIHSPDTQPPAG